MNSYICVDFDGTVVEHKFPDIGDPVPQALESIKELQKMGNKIILFTMRSGEFLDQAVEYLAVNGIELYGINVNPTQKEWTSSPKAYGHYYIDDAAVGVPLIRPESGRPFVDWLGVMELFRFVDQYPTIPIIKDVD